MAGRIRAGIGFDAHQLVAGRRLVLGGVELPFEKGLMGWSDADVLTHAIMDALLGAANLGDVGSHFPPGDPRYKDISSLILLKIVCDELAGHGWRVANIDATVVCEKPRLREHVDRMRIELGRRLGISEAQVSIKASTSDKMGFTGRGEGIAAYAIALLETKSD